MPSHDTWRVIAARRIAQFLGDYFPAPEINHPEVRALLELSDADLDKMSREVLLVDWQDTFTHRDGALSLKFAPDGRHTPRQPCVTGKYYQELRARQHAEELARKELALT